MNAAFAPQSLEVINEDHLQYGHQPGFDGQRESHGRSIRAAASTANHGSRSIAPSRTLCARQIRRRPSRAGVWHEGSGWCACLRSVPVEALAEPRFVGDEIGVSLRSVLSGLSSSQRSRTVDAQPQTLASMPVGLSPNRKSVSPRHSSDCVYVFLDQRPQASIVAAWPAVEHLCPPCSTMRNTNPGWVPGHLAHELRPE